MIDFEPDTLEMSIKIELLRDNLIRTPTRTLLLFIAVTVLPQGTAVSGEGIYASLPEEVPQHEQVWLDVNYPEQENSLQVMGLEQPPRTPESQGAVVVLHDTEQHADWPFIVRQLRQQLPDAGWYTFSVNLPRDDIKHQPKRVREPKTADQIILNDALKSALSQPPTRVPPAAASTLPNEEKPPASPEPETKESTETDPQSVDINLAQSQTQGALTLPYSVRAKAHLQAAMTHVSNKGYQNNIVIAIGSSADIALRYIQPIAAQQGDQGFALVMINPKLSNEFQRDISVPLGENFQAPILEVIDGSNPQHSIDSKKRLVLAKAAQSRHYQIIELASVQGERATKTLLKRISSWLTIYAPGMAATRYKK